MKLVVMLFKQRPHIHIDLKFPDCKYPRSCDAACAYDFRAGYWRDRGRDEARQGRCDHELRSQLQLIVIGGGAHPFARRPLPSLGRIAVASPLLSSFSERARDQIEGHSREALAARFHNSRRPARIPTDHS